MLRSVQGLERVRSEAAKARRKCRSPWIAGAPPRSASPRRRSPGGGGALRGENLREFRGSERELSMRLAFRESDRQNIDDLARLPLFLPKAARVT